MNPTAAFAVTEASQIAEPRRMAQWMTSRLEFTEQRAGQAALLVTELATNLVKHARGGELLLRAVTDRDGISQGIEVLALDKGPGMSDTARSSRDGHSTTGTLGHGLGAIERQSDSFDLYTHTSGTIIAACVYRSKPPPDRDGPPFQIGAVHVSKSGEDVCGDAWGWRMRDGRLSILIADGLGHGLHAHEAATAAVELYARIHEQPPARLIEDLHAALRPTRGAAVAGIAVDLERRVAAFAGLGNISGCIILPTGARHNLVSHNGTAGHTAGRIQEFRYPVPRNALLVMYSDGLGTHWDLGAYPGLAARSPSVIAGALYRDFSRRRDDVTVVVAKERRGVAQKV